MISIDDLRAYGANVDEGLARCMGMEDFYLQMVGMQLQDGGFDKLEAAISAGDAEEAFKAAHGLKGSLGNLALTPIEEPVIKMTERLRSADSMPDLSDLLPEYRKAVEDLKALCK